MVTIGAIFARGGSKGIPNKNLQRINGKSLVEISINDLKISNICKEIYLCSDDKSILEVGSSQSINIFLRNKSNCMDNSSEIDAWKEFCEYLISNSKAKIFDKILIAPTTSPLRKVNTLKEIVKIVEADNGCDGAVVIKQAERHPDFNILKKNKISKYLTNYSTKVRPVNRQACEDAYDMTTVCYCMKIESILKYNSLFEMKILGLIREKKECIDIDTPFDLELAKLLMSK